MPGLTTSRVHSFVLPALLLCGAFLLKWWYRTATVDELGFVLRPVVSAIGGITGEEWTFLRGEGYIFPGLGILIDRSCSGINFLVITTATFAFLVLKRSDGGCARPLLAMISVAGAYGLTILANTGRILSMVMTDRLGLHMGPTAHEALGAFFFLVALLLASLVLDRTLALKPPPHAHST